MNHCVKNMVRYQGQSSYHKIKSLRREVVISKESSIVLTFI